MYRTKIVLHALFHAALFGHAVKIWVLVTLGPRHVYHYNSCGLLHMAPLLNIFELLSVAIGSLEAITEGQ